MNYYTPVTEEHEAAFKTCLTKVVEIAVSNQCTQVLLAVPQRGALTGIIQETIGVKFINELLSKKRAKFKPLTFFLQTNQSKPTGFIKGPALAVYSRPEQLKVLEKNKNIIGIVLFSNVDGEIKEFKKNSNADELTIIYE